jgi:FkbM family methyltransferase
LISNHPLNKKNKLKAVLRFITWQINCILNPYPIVYLFTDKSKLIIQKGMTGATGNLYCGLHEYQDMFFLLHFLRRDDLFVDIGANIGSYSVLASAHVETLCISIEPVPSTYIHLINNIQINNIQSRVKPLNIALGSKEGVVNFTKNYDTTNHVATINDKDTITVNISLLDTILQNSIPILLKIDVEGFETEVLNGAPNTLTNNALKAIIIELNGSGTRYDYDESSIHEKLIELGFNPYIYDPMKRELVKIPVFGYGDNTLYIRDITFVSERLKNAEKINIFGEKI